MGFSCLMVTGPLWEEFTFYHLSPREFLTLIWAISEGWKIELTMEAPSAFEQKTPRLGIQRRKH